MLHKVDLLKYSWTWTAQSVFVTGSTFWLHLHRQDTRDVWTLSQHALGSCPHNNHEQVHRSSRAQKQLIRHVGVNEKRNENDWRQSSRPYYCGDVRIPVIPISLTRLREWVVLTYSTGEARREPAGHGGKEKRRTLLVSYLYSFQQINTNRKTVMKGLETGDCEIIIGLQTETVNEEHLSIIILTA